METITIAAVSFVISLTAGLVAFIVIAALGGGRPPIIAVASTAFIPWLISAVIFYLPIAVLFSRTRSGLARIVWVLLAVGVAIVPTALFTGTATGRLIPTFRFTSIDWAVFAMFAVAAVAFVYAADTFVARPRT